MGYIYKITNTTNGKSYIGQTINKLEKRINNHFNLNNKRCPALKRAIHKYGRDAFTVEILHEALDIFLDDLEIAEINKHNTIAPHGYNLQSGGNAGSTNRVVSDQTRKKISEAGKGKTHTPESRKKISDAHKGKTLSPETRKKLSEINKGKTLSPEIRKKISDGHKGKTFTPEHRQKISQAAERREPPSLKTRRKLSKGRKGKTHTPETRKKLSENKVHPGKPAAFQILNALPQDMPLTERRRILRDKFPERPRRTIHKWVKKWSETSASCN
ncbi:MAG: NUMOD3 domain-containing DNA-binding protein [Candidatus Poribacteria bacterium]|nr:NUMOD3 domain-containing DNA-binding protein [Candidatus Poribacteria bacterium]